MSELTAVLMKLGAVESKIENLVERSDEDRKDAGRHRQYQREQMSEMHDEIRSTNDQVTRIVPIVEHLHKKDQRKGLARDIVRGAGRYAMYAAATFTSYMMWLFGLFDRFKAFIATITH